VVGTEAWERREARRRAPSARRRVARLMKRTMAPRKMGSQASERVNWYIEKMATGKKSIRDCRITHCSKKDQFTRTLRLGKREEGKR